MDNINLTLELKKWFEFDKIFNLLDYNISLTELEKELRLLQKDSYKNNYRFIFLHYDTDYHITNDQPGLILRNLQRILFSLDISNFFSLILSQKNLQPHLDILQKQETTDDCSIACICHPLQEYVNYNYFPLEFNEDQIVYNFLSLNRIRRFHRTVLYSLLKSKNLLDKGAVSYCHRGT
jgi:hypothetical protein